MNKIYVVTMSVRNGPVIKMICIKAVYTSYDKACLDCAKFREESKGYIFNVETHEILA